MAKQSFIEIKGARVNNLKNLSVKIPHTKFTVITGLSGSGKSSLAFDTIFAEGQRRYIESLSSYARQFLGKLDKPEVDYIKGISPAIAIEQKVITNNPRSTVGTVTEIYDYLKLLFARIGKTYSPISGKEVKKHSISDVVDFGISRNAKSRLLILSPLPNISKYGSEQQFKILQQQGYARIFFNDEIHDLEDALKSPDKFNETSQLIVDRVIVDNPDEEFVARFADSVQLAFTEGDGECFIYEVGSKKSTHFSTRFELDGIEFQIPSNHFFSFNNPVGACKTCEGYGQIIGVDEDLVIPDKSLSVYNGAIAAWKGESMKEYLNELIFNATKFDFPIHRPINELNEKQYRLLWEGNRYFTGLNPFFEFIESQAYKIQYRVLLSRYRGKTNCPECKGTRLRGDANYVKISDCSISDIVLTSIESNLFFFKNLKLNQQEAEISKRILPEIINRLSYLCQVGLGYLSLNRQSGSLSGGESQRVNLATTLGSNLVGSMYILDEPSIGLHPKDAEKLIKILHQLRDMGNTVIVVEHEEAMMKAADEILDIGPMAGAYGGEVVFQGKYDKLSKSDSITAAYLTKKRFIPIPTKRRIQKNKLHFSGIRKHNLKNVEVSIPLNNLVCITGVSGSGKSTLIKDIVYPSVLDQLGQTKLSQINFKTSGDFKQIQAVELIDQKPIGRSSRSNPVTYVKAFDEIRQLYADQKNAKARAYKPGFFSFNIEGGRCEMCEGEGIITVSMQFMADIHLTCEACQGKRYKNETLEIKYRDVNISELLEMDVDQALNFFKQQNGKSEQKIVEKLQPLVDVGLGYLKMGQPSSTLSGGEAQRIKLASFLAKGSQASTTLFIFDEPTTGLHFYDIEKLMLAFNRLISSGHSIIVIEHNLEVVKCADWVIDLGPEGGENGGTILFEGTPEQLILCEESYTGQFLKPVLKDYSSTS